jgi:hypothetical protein
MSQRLLTNARRAGGIAFLFLCPAVGVAQSGATANIRIGRNYQISGSLPDESNWEVLGDADPRQARRLIACGIISRLDLPPDSSSVDRTVVYTSIDSGKTWHLSFGPTPGDRARTDPNCVFGPDGAAYFVTLRAGSFGAAGGGGYGTEVYRAADGLHDWKLIATINISDRPFVFFDRTSEHGHGTLYVSGSSSVAGVPATEGKRGVAIYAISGETSSLADQRFVAVRTSPGPGVLTSGGNYVVLSKRIDSNSVVNGRTFYHGTIEVVDVPLKSNERPTLTRVGAWESCQLQLDSHEASIAIDKSNGPFRDRIYVAWPGWHKGRCQILFAYSDRGQRWTVPAPLNDDALTGSDTANASSALAALAVNSRGVLGVTWYDRRNSPDGWSRTLRFAASYDGGHSFAPSVDVSPMDSAAYSLTRSRRLEVHEGRGTAAGGQATEVSLRPAEARGGESMGLCADMNGVFHAVWVDSRLGTSQMWAAAVDAPGTAMVAPGAAAPEASGTEAATSITPSTGSRPRRATPGDSLSEVRVRFSRATYDPSTHQLTLQMELRNSSSRTMTGTLHVRVDSVSSPFGPVQVSSPDSGNGQTEVGWNVSLPSAGLQPGHSTIPRKVTFTLSGSPQIRRSLGDKNLNTISFLNVFTRVDVNGDK